MCNIGTIVTVTTAIITASCIHVSIAHDITASIVDKKTQGVQAESRQIAVGVPGHTLEGAESVSLPLIYEGTHVDVSEGRTKPLVFYDVDNVTTTLRDALTTLTDAVTFYTKGTADVISPLNNYVAQMPVFLLLTTWFSLMVIFYGYQEGLFSCNDDETHSVNNKHHSSTSEILEDVYKSLRRSLEQHHDFDHNL